ncbi:MAG: DUF1553 domain-containing protein [Planctomycetes bacterium]|nr:DUF1553 domain-containing protein [Planctomycetota bacterium]
MAASRTANDLRVFLVLIAVVFGLNMDAAAQEIDFDQQVAPLIARRCAGCHNASDPKGGLDLTTSEGLARGGDSGPAVDPADRAQSLLWQRIAAGEMPPQPGAPLEPGERKLLQQWIRSGASWGARPINPLEYSSDARAGYDWWSLQPIGDVTPLVGHVLLRAAHGPIDCFIGAALARAELAHAPQALPRELARRTALDLIGILPALEELDDFVDDSAPDAYERWLDRLQSSPRYGERWARHWLDLIRFGESQGFERDKLRTNAWRYRDWVVAALNRDLAYDEFARLQLAGDILGQDDAGNQIATGFLVAGAYDEVGQSQQSQAMRAIVRQDEMEDIVAAVSQTFLGLTTNCARCHDHKFDPVSQKEYYQFAAALSGVRHGEREWKAEQNNQVAGAPMIALQQRRELLRDEAARRELPAREAVLAERKANPVRNTPAPVPVASWEFSAPDRVSPSSLQGSAKDSARLADGRLLLDGAGHYVTPPLPFELRAKTLEVFLQLHDLDQRGGGAISVQTLDGSIFDAIVFGEKEAGRWMAGSNGFSRYQSFQGQVETEAAQRAVWFAISYHEDGTIAAFRNGQPYGEAYRSAGLQPYPTGQAQLVFGLRHAPPGGNRMLKAGILSARLYDRALTASEAAAAAAVAGAESDYVSPEELAAHMAPEDWQRLQALQFEIHQLGSQIDRWQEIKFYANSPRQPEPTHLLQRGQTTRKGELVSASGIRALRSCDAEWGLAPDAPEDQARRRLADWISDRRNPLFSRVVVNRLWHYHFGVGIVDTTNDFGFNGGRPSHPDLLDWLAAALWRFDGSWKRLHREILVSATYRQSSRHRPDCAAKDAANRLGWRKEPLRLDAEVLRDCMLEIAGELNWEMRGPGYHDFTTYVHNTQFYEMKNPLGATFNRRSLYRTWVRSGRSNFLDVFDCPDPSTKTPVRATTTTPLQSLALLNNAFSLRIADQLAGRVEREARPELSSQIVQLVRLVYGRAPVAEELRTMREFAQHHGLPALGRVLINSNEFLYAP